MTNKSLTVGLIAVAIIAIGGYFFPQIQSLVGSVGTRFPNGLAVGTTATVTQNKITIGNSGTALGNVLFGTCNAQQKSTGSFAATTSAQFYCAVTGAASGDNVQVMLPAGAGTNADGAASITGGFVVVSASATSSNFIQFTLDNFTGAATSSFAQATTSVQYTIFR